MFQFLLLLAHRFLVQDSLNRLTMKDFRWELLGNSCSLVAFLQSTEATRKSLGKPAEVTFKPTVTSLNKSAAFVFGSPVAKPFFQPGNRRTRVTIATSAPTSGKKLKLKSPKIFKPILPGTSVSEGKPKTPVARKSFAAITTGEKRPKTPANPAHKSVAVTPFRFEFCCNFLWSS